MSGLSNEELRDKYITKKSDYSYISNEELDEILKKLEELSTLISDLTIRVDTLERG